MIAEAAVTFPGAFEQLGAASEQLLAADAQEVVLLLEGDVVADAAAVALQLAVLLLRRAVLLVVPSATHRALLHRDHRRDVPHFLQSPRLQRRRASQRCNGGNITSCYYIYMLEIRFRGNADHSIWWW